MAYIHDVGVQTHVCSSPLSVAISLHFEAALPHFVIHEHHIANALPSIAAQCKYDYQPKNGYFEIPELPGIGNELSGDALKKATIVTVK